MEDDAQAAGGGLSVARIGLLLLLGGAVLLFLLLGGSDLLSLEQLKASRESLLQQVEARPLATMLLFGLTYVLVVALSIPGAALMTLAAGALFGPFKGVLIAATAATAGATLAMLAARFIARAWVRTRFPAAVETIDKGIARDGDIYLLSLRLAPIFPFFLINLAMGLTRMPAGRFAVLTLVGALPGTIAYTLAGAALADIDSLSDAASPQLIGAFLLLALLPPIGRWAARRLARRRAQGRFRKPRRFDSNLVVIGAGSAGLVAALVAREAGAKVVLIESGAMGGDCLNTGCVPSKSMIRAARAANEARQAKRFGVDVAAIRVDFPGLMSRVSSVIGAIAPNDSVERYQALGVDVRKGSARLIDPWTVEIDGSQRITAREIVIATGAEPIVPAIPGLESSGYVTSDTLWTRLSTMSEVPGRLVVLGGGPIGCELGQALARLGSAVTIVSSTDRLLAREDPDVGRLVAEALAGDDIALWLGRRAVQVDDGALRLDDGTHLPFDLLLVAVGRTPVLHHLGLESIGIDTSVPVRRQVREPWPHIRFVGDAAGEAQFTHFAGHSGAVAALNAVAAPLARLKTDSLVPRVTYTDPEVASIGLSEDEAAASGKAVETILFELSELDRAIIDGSTSGFVKLLLKPGSDRVLGVTIVGPRAGDLILPWTLAIRHRVGLKRMLSLIYPYPGYAEAGRAAAGKWRRANKPQRALALFERWLKWRRGG